MQLQLKWTVNLRLIFVLLACRAAFPQASQGDLTTLNLEDLMNLEITSVSKKEQKISHVASAIFVINSEDIRHSGATNIPDLLRMVPGLNVAQIDSNLWAISARGFNSAYSDKLLVMLDGRSVYTPTFSGVFWDVLDLPLEDIERIEVIRGPGGTTWGANAVNGVINIITKKATQTHGGMLTAGGGNLDQGFGTVEYGGSLGKGTDYRVFTKYFNQYHQPGPTGQSGDDGWHLLRGGFRTDSKLSAKDDLAVLGDVYTGQEGQLAPVIPSVTLPTLQYVFRDPNLSGGFIQTDWNHRYSSRSDTTLQLSFDRYRRTDNLRETRNTLNVDFQHHFAWGERQDIVWGLEYRNSLSTSGSSLQVALHPAELTTQLFSSFVQDEITLVPNRLSLTVGTKLEHNRSTEFGLMPNLRAAWTLNERQMVWASASWAIQTPSTVETDVRGNLGGFINRSGTPVLLGFFGNPDLKDERLFAYEAGYRAQVADRLSFDLAAYYNSYNDLASFEPSAPFVETTPAPTHRVVPFHLENPMYGETHGLEISGRWKAADRWTLTPAYAFELIDLHLDPASQSMQSIVADREGTPRHWARLDSRLDLTHTLAWDTSANFVGELFGGKVPSYSRLDTQLTWRAGESLSLSLVGQDLLKDRHLEFMSMFPTSASSFVKRSVYAKLTWWF